MEAASRLKEHWLFRLEPRGIARFALLADLLGSLLASILLFVVERLGLFSAWDYPGDIPREPAPFWDSLYAHLYAFGFWAPGIGLVLVLLYVIPVMVLLRRFGLAGPLTALSIAVLPGLLISVWALGLGLLFVGFGLSVALVFCGLAYRRHVV